MIRSGLCDHSGAYIDVNWTIIITNTGTEAAPGNENKKVKFRNCSPFTNYKSETNNAKLDDAPDIDVVMPMHNLITYSDNYWKIFRRLWQY